MWDELIKKLIIIIEKANWIDLSIGFLLSLLIPLLILIYQFFKFLLNDYYYGYYGNYYLYAYFLLQRKDEKSINAVKFTIKRNYFGKPKILWYDGKYKYKGTIKIYDKNVYISVTGMTHKEEQLLIFIQPLIPEQFDLILGIKSAVTNNGEPAASINLLSRNKLLKEDITRILGTNKTLKINAKLDSFKALKDKQTLLPK